MKKIIITTLSLVSLCFASEGAADYLASLVLGVFALIAIPVIVCFCGVVFEAIVDFFQKTMEKDKFIRKTGFVYYTFNRYFRINYTIYCLQCYTNNI